MSPEFKNFCSKNDLDFIENSFLEKDYKRIVKGLKNILKDRNLISIIKDENGIFNLKFKNNKVCKFSGNVPNEVLPIKWVNNNLDKINFFEL